MEVSYSADRVESVFERCEGRGLWKQHEKPVEALVKERVFLRLEKLKSEVWVSVSTVHKGVINRKTCR